MTHEDTPLPPGPVEHTPWHRTWPGLAGLGAAAAAAAYLSVFHAEHTLDALPLLALLLCPLMHVFMHGGHRRDGKDCDSGGDTTR